MHGLSIAGMQCVALLLVVQHTWVGLAELAFFEAVAIFLGSLGHLFFNLFVVLCHLVFNENIGPIAFL